MSGEHDRLTREVDDGAQIGSGIDVAMENMGIARHGVGRHQNAVAVGGAFGDLGHADRAVGAGLILDEDLLAQHA